MTLIAALRCSDGAILASDSRETRGAAGRKLARPSRKIYEPRSGFVLAWAGFQDVAQAFALRVERQRGLSPRLDRLQVRDHLVSCWRQVREDDSIEERGDYAEFFVAWWSVPDDKPLVLHIHSGGATEWVEEWSVGGSPRATEVASIAFGTLRYLHPPDLTVAQGRIIALKVVRDAIAAGVEEIGGEVQLGTVRADGVDVLDRKRLRGLHDTLDVWEEQTAELLPGGVEVPADSASPDRGVRPPA